jgi:hypothetical protein
VQLGLAMETELQKQYKYVVQGSRERIQIDGEHARRGRKAWGEIHEAAELVQSPGDVHTFRATINGIITEFGDESNGCAMCVRHATGASGDGCGLFFDKLNEFARWTEAHPKRHGAVDAHKYATAWASSLHKCVSLHVWKQMQERDPATGKLNPSGAYVSLASLEYVPPPLPLLPSA